MDIKPVNLRENPHPHKKHQAEYDDLIGIDKHKQDLLNTLMFIFDKKGIEKWKKEHHPKGLPFADKALSTAPLILLSGEVGCGKTALANSIATPLANKLDTHVKCFETPSDIRGGGHVGELSARVTSAFEQAKAKLDGKPGILIIDEADDLATSRAQMQAHHEDRSGVNVLIKEIDQIERQNAKLAVIIITNRASALDPAVIRRASLHLTFSRPSADVIGVAFKNILNGIKYSEEELQELIDLCGQKAILYSYSDIYTRVGKQAIIKALTSNQPFNINIIKEIISETEPSPLIE